MAKKRKAKRRIPSRVVTLLAINATPMRAFVSVRSLMQLNAGRIVNKIIAQVTATILANGKQVNNGVFAEWRPKLLDSVLNNLLLGNQWDAVTEANVLSVASDMGTISVLLAGANVNVAKSQIHAAFNAVQQAHTVCAAGMGGGSWCDFAM